VPAGKKGTCSFLEGTSSSSRKVQGTLARYEEATSFSEESSVAIKRWMKKKKKKEKHVFKDRGAARGDSRKSERITRGD